MKFQSSPGWCLAFAMVLFATMSSAWAVDLDGDGVDDAIDVCNNTPPGIPVDADGRPLGDVDQDCDSDLSDFALIQQAITGPLNPVGACCYYPDGVCEMRTAAECPHVWQGAGVSCEGVYCPTRSCMSNDRCDNGLFCDGAEWCQNGVCLQSDPPCNGVSACDENNDVCLSPGNIYNLTTGDDVITGTNTDETFVATIGTLNPGDILIGNGGYDELDAAVAGTGASGATLIDIDSVNMMSLNSVTFDAGNTSLVSVLNVAPGSTGNLTIYSLEEGIALGMGNNYNRTLTATLDNDAAATDELDLNLQGVAGAAFNYVSHVDDLELLIVSLSGTNTIEPADDANNLFFGDVAVAEFTGNGDLILSGFDSADIAGTTWSTNGFTGVFWLSPEADAGGFTADLTVGGDLAGFDDLDRYIINDTMTFNHALRLDNTDHAVTVEIESISGGDLAGNLTVTQGTGSNDSVTVMLGGAGDGMGNIGASATEFLTIDSSGDDGNAVGAVSLAGAGGATPFVTETITVVGDQDLTIGEVVADVVTAATFGASLDVTGSGDPNRLIGSPQDDTLDGAAGIDQIEGGGGDDTIVGGAAADMLTGGAGVDTFVDTDAVQDLITDFVPGTVGDVFAFDISSLEAAIGGGINFNRPGKRDDRVGWCLGKRPGSGRWLAVDDRGRGGQCRKCIPGGLHEWQRCLRGGVLRGYRDRGRHRLRSRRPDLRESRPVERRQLDRGRRPRGREFRLPAVVGLGRAIVSLRLALAVKK